MKHSVIGSALALLVAGAVVNAQGAGQPQNPPRETPQTQQAPRVPPAPQTPAASEQATTTLVGCLYREAQVPGRQPNVAERAGILEDYILADASMASAPAKPGATAGATGTTGAAPTTGNMYKVEGPADEKLKSMVGKRVEVTGRIDPEGRPGAGAGAGAATVDRGPGPDDINLPEFEASAIREVSGTCPATPAAVKPAPRN